MREAQRRAAAFARDHRLNMDPQVRFLDLTSELGELSKELLKASCYGTEPFRPAPSVEDELGDCAFSLLCLADSLGLDAGKALDGALEKYKKRFAETGEAGSGR